MKIFLLIFTMLLIPLSIEYSYAESFDFEYFTGELFQINYELDYGTITELSINKSQIIFNLNTTDGTFHVNFPKAIPLGTLDNDYPLFVTSNNGSAFHTDLLTKSGMVQTTNECSFDLEIKYDNKHETAIQVVINHAMYPEGYTLRYFDLTENCLNEDSRNDTELQRLLDGKICSLPTYKISMNNRNDFVCVSEKSTEILKQRMYLIDKEIKIINNYN